MFVVHFQLIGTDVEVHLRVQHFRHVAPFIIDPGILEERQMILDVYIPNPQRTQFGFQFYVWHKKKIDIYFIYSLCTQHTLVVKHLIGQHCTVVGYFILVQFQLTRGGVEVHF